MGMDVRGVYIHPSNIHSNNKEFENTICTRDVQKMRGQMTPFPQFLTERHETCT